MRESVVPTYKTSADVCRPTVANMGAWWVLQTRRALVHFGQPALNIGAAVPHLATKSREARAAAFEPPVIERRFREPQINGGFTGGQ